MIQKLSCKETTLYRSPPLLFQALFWIWVVGFSDRRVMFMLFGGFSVQSSSVLTPLGLARFRPSSGNLPSPLCRHLQFLLCVRGETLATRESSAQGGGRHLRSLGAAPLLPKASVSPCEALRSPPRSRLLHPVRGVRVGEAAVPGPSTSQATLSDPNDIAGATATASRDLSGTQAPRDGTHLREVLPPLSPRGPPAVPSMADTVQDTMRDTGFSEAPTAWGDNLEIQNVHLKLKAISGRTITLQCRWMKRDAAWKWFAETQGTRLHHQSRNTPGTVLLEWLERFDQHLSAEGVREVESALAIHPDPPHGPPDSLNRTPAGSEPNAGTPAAPSTPALLRLPGTPSGPRVPATPVSLPVPVPSEQVHGETARPPPDSGRCVGCAFWLGKAIPTQRQLPKTSRELVDATCHRLLLLMGDPAVTATQRRTLVALSLTMPRWLWPEPPKAPGSHLHPHSRPRLLQERAQMALQSDWEGLLTHVQPDATPPANPADATPRTPGLLTDADCKRLMRAGRQGRVATAWRQLFSYGLALSNDRTQRLIESKWLPAPLFPEQPRGTYLSPSDAKDLVSDDHILQASRALTAGSCTDALGWTHENWRTVLQLPHGKRLMRELLTLYACGELGHEGEDLINSSLLIPLYKNGSGDAIRPIAVPTTFRKAYARATLARHRQVLSDACGPHQYAAMTKDGARLIATHLRRHQSESGIPPVYIRTDIHNAFNEVDRGQVLQSLETAHPLLAASQYPWLHRPSQAVMQAPEGTRRLLSTHQGIPQGDPLSSLTFAVTLAKPLQTMADNGYQPFAYADDVVLAAPADRTGTALAEWRDQLGCIGLRLNQHKLHFWNPGLHDIPLDVQETYPDLQISAQGFVVCGLPIDSEEGPADERAGPWGTASYVDQFLQEVRQTLAGRLRTLATFVNHHGPHTEALHIALSIVRIQLLTRHVHLARFCQRDSFHRWAGEIDRDIIGWLTNVLELPLDTPAARSVLAVPVSRGGLGFLHPQHEAALHYLQAVMPLVGEWTSDEEGDCLHRLVAETLEYLNHHARVDLRPLVAHLEPARQPRKIRDLFYERLALQMQDLCPWLIPPGLPTTPDGEITYRWMLRCQLSWYVRTPGCPALVRAPLRLALASYMGLPVFAPGQRCHYTPVTTGRRCHQQLGTHSEHVFACAHSPGMRRHNRLRDAWMQLAKTAGWHAQTEQLVFTAADICKRADIVALAPDGTKFACDVMVTASPTPCERHGPHLEKMAAAKARMYNTVSWGKCHEDATFVALVHDAHQHWLHADALRLLHRLVMAVAHRTAPEAPRAWGFHVSQTTLQCATPILHAACLAAWQMHAACGCLL